MDQQISRELPPVQALEAESNSFGSTPEVGRGVETTEIQNNKALEAGVSSSAGSSPPLAQPMASQGTMPVAVAPQQQMAQSPGGFPQIADDTDLIEKEWVLKAKEIVARTQHDPHQQNKEMEHIKADYLKKRYNKDIKLTDE